MSSLESADTEDVVENPVVVQLEQELEETRARFEAQQADYGV